MTIARSTKMLVLIGVLSVIVAACSRAENPDFLGLDESFDAPPMPELDFGTVAAGEILYAQFCASCHLADLSGNPDWKIPNADGTYPPPPHDVSGHTWHHSDDLLLEIVRDGIEGVASAMPTFGDVLTDEEILSIIEFFKSQWGDEERTFQWQVTWQEQQG